MIKHHLIAAIVAAVIAFAIAAIVVHVAPVEQITRIEQVTHAIAASKHAWPDLTDAEKAQLAQLAKDLPKSVRIDIVCNDAGCSDLAADLDDAFEDARVDSALDRSLGPLGYGIGVSATEFDKTAAQMVANIIAAATGLQPAVVPGKSATGYVTILIGKHPRG